MLLLLLGMGKVLIFHHSLDSVEERLNSGSGLRQGCLPNYFGQLGEACSMQNGVKMVTSFDQEANFGRKVCPQYMQDLLYHFFTPGFALIQK